MITSALIRERIAREFTQQPAAALSWSLRPVGGREMAVSAEILVVDDELDLREMVAEYLARHGFHVRTAIDVIRSERSAVVPFDTVAQPERYRGAVLVPAPTGRQIRDDRIEPALLHMLVEHDQVVEHRHQRPCGQRVHPVNHRQVRRTVPQMYPEDAASLLSCRRSSSKH